MRANERRMLILETLCARRQDTMQNLAFEFNVTRRTILADIETLSLSYPIYTIKGGRNSGGVYISEDYYLGKRYLNSEQQALIERLVGEVDENDAKVLTGILERFTPKRREK